MKYNLNRPDKIIPASKVEDIPDYLTKKDALIKFIKKKKQASYSLIDNHLSLVPESSLRRLLKQLMIRGVIKREKCLCGQGFIYEIKKKK